LGKRKRKLAKPRKVARITNIQHVVEIATTLTQSWFRGHDRAFGELTPRIFRPPFSDEAYRQFRPDIELEFIEEFKRDAPTLAVGYPLPPDDDHLGWLYLMRHYGAPTRLLDWTKSALIALWFAVTEHQKEDGELWALYPKRLNEKAGAGFGMPIVGTNPAIQFLVQEPYWHGPREQLAKSLSIKAPIRTPIAFEPKRSFARMVVQSSAFTIHPWPTTGNTIPDLLTEKQYLTRWIVPADMKRVLQDNLIALGITHVTLFPDFEGLSKRLIDSARVIGYGPPDPPACAGP
jgi:hypothetical protein